MQSAEAISEMLAAAHAALCGLTLVVLLAVAAVVRRVEATTETAMNELLRTQRRNRRPRSRTHTRFARPRRD